MTTPDHATKGWDLSMKSKALFWFALSLATSHALALTPGHRYEQGTVLRMHMGECITAQHGFMAAMSGSPVQQSAEMCPEYTLATDKAVYVIVGKGSTDIIPLARVISFRFDRNELAVRFDDERRETRFRIKEMELRTEWELQRAAEEKRADWVRQHVESALVLSGTR